MRFALFFLWVCFGQLRAEVTLQQVVASALARDVQKDVVLARQEEAEALLLFSRQFLAKAPAIALSYGEDSATTNVGSRQWGMALELPLWWPGQHTRAKAVGEQSMTLAEKFAASRVLVIAGQVREAIAAVTIARAKLESASHEAHHAGEIAADLKKRFDLGEASRRDWLLATQNQKRYEDLLQTAQAEMDKAMATYRVLTGLTEYPGHESLATPAALHPLLALANADENLAKAQMALVQKGRGDNPMLTFGTNRERGVASDPYATNLMIGIRIPFATEAFNAPAIAQARNSWADRSAEKAQIERQILLAQEQGRRDLAALQKSLKVAQTRLDLANETTQMAKQAYDSGEENFLDYLKIEGERADAEVAYALRLAEYHRAIAMLNQAYGVIP
jgi:outer membrane protein TolC